MIDLFTVPLEYPPYFKYMSALHPLIFLVFLYSKVLVTCFTLHFWVLCLSTRNSTILLLSHPMGLL